MLGWWPPYMSSTLEEWVNELYGKHNFCVGWISQGIIGTSTSSFSELKFSSATVCLTHHILMILLGSWRKAVSECLIRWVACRSGHAQASSTPTPWSVSWLLILTIQAIKGNVTVCHFLFHVPNLSQPRLNCNYCQSMYLPPENI